MNDNSILDKKIEFICKSQYPFFLNKSNVQGLALGYKIKRGFNTYKKCITVFVSNKISKNLLTYSDIVPNYFKGILTDVVESGFFSECSLRNKIRPVKGGYNVSAAETAINGTAGCLVTNGASNFLLSSNHMIADLNSLPIGTPIVQPSHTYGGRTPQDTIGGLYKYVPLRFINGESQPINLSDSAIGLLSSPEIFSPEIALLGTLNCVKNPSLNQSVKKVGSTSELTNGTVNNTSGTLIINYIGGQRCLFNDLIITTLMSTIGDSGAILVNNNMCALGLLFSMSFTFSVYCRLSTVLAQLGVNLVT